MVLQLGSCPVISAPTSLPSYLICSCGSLLVYDEWGCFQSISDSVRAEPDDGRMSGIGSEGGLTKDRLIHTRRNEELLE